MFLPLLLIGLATGAAAVIAYGTHPGLMHYAHGLEMIMLSRRLEWPLVTLCLVLCIALLALVIANRQRAWWLIGLAPVLALFVHHFAPNPRQQVFLLDSPATFVDPSPQSVPRDDAWVVGIVFEDQAYALPYSALYTTPVVFITDYDKRMLVMWSARANHASAFRVARELKSRDLEIVSTPADTLLIYDHRLGQFIVALTGQTVGGDKPIGFAQTIETIKTTWPNWRKQHPSSKVMSGYEMPGAPTMPIAPTSAGTIIDGAAAETRVAVVHSSPPVAILSDSIEKQLVNTVAGSTRILVLRDRTTGRLRAFNRNASEDLFLSFVSRSDRKHPEVSMIDSDTNSSWTSDGKAVDGPLKGSQLKELWIEDDLFWGPMRTWCPEMTMAK